MAYKWDNYPLKIKTSRTTAVISIKANVDPNSSLLPKYEGMTISLTIRIPDNVVEIENHYTSKTADMELDLSNMRSSDNVWWVLYKLKRKLVIKCRGEKVWEMDYINLFDRKYDGAVFSQRSMRAWSKKVEELMFTDQHTAGLSYRRSGRL